MDIFNVILTKQAKRDLLKVPLHVVRKFQAWIDDVETTGLNETKRIPGYHDEPLKGKRIGERSVRLTRAYRVIYTIDKHGKIEIIKVLEVNKHDY